MFARTDGIWINYNDYFQSECAVCTVQWISCEWNKNWVDISHQLSTTPSLRGSNFWIERKSRARIWINSQRFLQKNARQTPMECWTNIVESRQYRFESEKIIIKWSRHLILSCIKLNKNSSRRSSTRKRKNAQKMVILKCLAFEQTKTQSHTKRSELIESSNSKATK